MSRSTSTASDAQLSLGESFPFSALNGTGFVSSLFRSSSVSNRSISTGSQGGTFSSTDVISRLLHSYDSSGSAEPVPRGPGPQSSRPAICSSRDWVGMYANAHVDIDRPLGVFECERPLSRESSVSFCDVPSLGSLPADLDHEYDRLLDPVATPASQVAQEPEAPLPQLLSRPSTSLEPSLQGSVTPASQEAAQEPEVPLPQPLSQPFASLEPSLQGSVPDAPAASGPSEPPAEVVVVPKPQPQPSSTPQQKRKKRKRPPPKNLEPEVKVFVEVTDLDVLCGRGGKTNHHPGNKRYLQEVEDLKSWYSSSQKDKKTVLAQLLVDAVHEYGGRFLKKEKGRGWYIVTNLAARRKASQALREENTPEARLAKRKKYGKKKESEALGATAEKSQPSV